MTDPAPALAPAPAPSAAPTGVTALGGNRAALTLLAVQAWVLRC
ncbi:hypothetical protein [Deinococcus radiophilus]